MGKSIWLPGVGISREGTFTPLIAPAPRRTDSGACPGPDPGFAGMTGNLTF